jgi:predicted ATPase
MSSPGDLMAARRTIRRYELLAPVYRQFTEGFDTRDLQEAKAPLNELVA